MKTNTAKKTQTDFLWCSNPSFPTSPLQILIDDFQAKKLISLRYKRHSSTLYVVLLAEEKEPSARPQEALR